VRRVAEIARCDVVFVFLEYVYGIEKSEAGMLNSLSLIAVVVGSISGGVIVDWLL